jgi:putative lipoic acid-binding regulatory protein
MKDKNPKPSGSESFGMSKEEFYGRLREELEKNHEWPTKYMYKFIIPNDENKVEEVKKRFDKEYQFRQNYSRTGKFISLTFVTDEKSADDIIAQYRKMEDIEGLIAI